MEVVPTSVSQCLEVRLLVDVKNMWSFYLMENIVKMVSYFSII